MLLELHQLQKLDDYRWLVPRGTKPGMLTDALIYTNERLLVEKLRAAGDGLVAVPFNPVSSSAAAWRMRDLNVVIPRSAQVASCGSNQRWNSADLAASSQSVERN